MTKDEALKMCLEYIETNAQGSKFAILIKEALAQPEQEPVGQLLEDAFGRGQVMWFNKPKDESMLYTTPPQRTWVGLTDEEENEYNYLGPDMHWVIQEIAAKLKEKNT